MEIPGKPHESMDFRAWYGKSSKVDPCQSPADGMPGESPTADYRLAPSRLSQYRHMPRLPPFDCCLETGPDIDLTS